MIIKDYYSILEVSPSATILTIKRAYRRLALKYHPDKNGGNALYEQKFREINEAYRVLSDVQKRNDYNYARAGRRHHNHQRTYADPVNTTSIIAHTKKLQDKVMHSDPARMNTEALYRQVMLLLNERNYLLFNKEGDEQQAAIFIKSIFFICRNLPYPSVQNVVLHLVHFAGTNNKVLTEIREFEQAVKYRWLWHQYKILLVIFMVIIICLFIYSID